MNNTRGKQKIISWISLLVAVGILFFAALPDPVSALDNAGMAGSYRCWQFSAGSIGGACTNPPLVLKKDGTYRMSTEKGTYTLNGNTILLSKSTFRGLGVVTEDGMQIRFTYEYRGQGQTVTYLRETPSEASGALVLLDLTIKYLKEEKWLGWVSTVELTAIDGKDKTNYTALAWTKDYRSVLSNFKKGVPGGREYTVFINTGTDRVAVGKIDLKKMKGEVKKTLFVKGTPSAKKQNGSKDKKKEASDKSETKPFPTLPSETKSNTPSKSLPVCNPLVPRYAQPECKE